MGLERKRRRMGWAVAWKRPVQLFAAMAEAWLALRFCQRIQQMVVGLPI
jgi:hypothetical protein